MYSKRQSLKTPPTLDLQPKAVFRCDGNRGVGLGHLSRCVALAEAMEEVGVASVFMGDYSEPARRMIISAGFDFSPLPVPSATSSDVKQLQMEIGRAGATVCVIDHYGYSDRHVKEIHQNSVPVWLIDDFCARSEYRALCAGLINFTVGAPCMPYPKKHLTCLLGPTAFLTRRSLRNVRRRGRPVRRTPLFLLVAIGGNDLHDLSLRAIGALDDTWRRLSVRVVVSTGQRQRARLERMISKFGPASEVICELPDLASEFERADLCLSGGGLTKYESAFLGLPCAVASQTHEQWRETRNFSAAGLGFDLGQAWRLSDQSLRRRLNRWLSGVVMSGAARRELQRTFTADPTLRVARAIREHLDSQELG
jgi:spore coat polysaccharide biosynthesis predicted glycosyltransferase SpsG